MTASRYPLLFATLGEDAASIPDALARTLETTLSATGADPAGDDLTLLGCLQRIRRGEGADGQPWARERRTPGQCMALERIDRATAGLTVLLELLHATERVRVDGGEEHHVGDSVREGLLLACRGLSEYVGSQLPSA
ncbi:hypothetical protein [Stenotrophomonas sp. 24(2023)]|uniref:hypothetical protein n=1 Tax=Stenotrophomonas sp. 24(2023) TaxID=3068324 RepID=UPI0027DF8059|nr:hypothetical protein [Stenotrophomonas sp. 24(2023)]WMJ70358.1 hypothetical protein Q9R17_04435 [Stenotrophomonas sp. 24(2023)]